MEKFYAWSFERLLLNRKPFKIDIFSFVLLRNPSISERIFNFALSRLTFFDRSMKEISTFATDKSFVRSLLNTCKSSGSGVADDAVI
jgi:hypothetical protein